MPASKLDRGGRGVEVERHLAAAVEFIKIAESGDAEKTAYEHAADEIIAAQHEDPTLSFSEIDRRLGQAKSKGRYSQRLVQWRTGPASAPTPYTSERQNMQREARKAREIARKQPDTFVAAFEAAPPEAKQQIAEQISRNREVRMEARKHDFEDRRNARPNDVPRRPLALMFEAESKLTTIERMLREFIAIVNGIDQSGDDEDVIEQLERIEKLTAIARETYESGKSIDLWTMELWEQFDKSERGE